MIAAITISALAIIAALVGAVWFVLRMLQLAHKDSNLAYLSLSAETRAGFTFQQRISVLQAANEDFVKAQTALARELSRETAARKLAEKQRDTVLAELAKGGDPAAIHELINRELSAFADLGKTP